MAMLQLVLLAQAMLPLLLLVVKKTLCLVNYDRPSVLVYTAGLAAVRRHVS